MIAWDAGNPVTGEGSLAGASHVARVELTTVPTFLSRADTVPPRYYNLGTLGQYAGDYREPGQRITYTDQQVAGNLTDADGWYWVLPSGVSGTIYRGVQLAEQLALGARVYRATAQSIPDNVVTELSFSNAEFDPYNLAGSFTEPTKLRTQDPGWYHVGAAMRWTPNVTGYRGLWIRWNNGPILARSTLVPSADVTQPLFQFVDTVAYLPANNYVEAVVIQNSGGALSTIVTANVRPDMWLVKVG